MNSIYCGCFSNEYDEPLILLASLTREWESRGRSYSRQKKSCFIISNMSEVTRCQTLEINGIQNDIRSKSEHTEKKQFELHSTKRSDLVFSRVEGGPLMTKKYQAAYPYQSDHFTIQTLKISHRMINFLHECTQVGINACALALLFSWEAQGVT